MRRFLALVVVFMLLGAAVNVLVAWVAAIVPIYAGGSATRPYPSRNPWPAYIEAVGWGEPQWIDRFSGVLFDQTEQSSLPIDIKLAPDYGTRSDCTGNLLITKRFGWPSRSLLLDEICAYSQVDTPRMFDAAANGGTRVGFSTRRWLSRGDYWNGTLPIHILPVGFIVNTVVYAAVGWSLPFLSLTALKVLRTHRRSRLGRCIACGYDLRGADHKVCPECGTPPPCGEAPRELKVEH
ncbi:MAG: hypothetical protein KJZ69_07945 [Phycisphaerales bacterium]|nr:hypothetical protein [Phycisphaerales bacterium]